MEQNFLLSIGDERNLPVYLSYIGENEYQPHIVRPMGFHSAQIIYCTAGEGYLSLNGKEYTITENTAFYLPPKIPHEYKAAGDGKWFTHYIAFDGYASELLMRQLGYSDGGAYEVDTKALDEIFRRILFSIKSDREYCGYTNSATVYEFIMQFHKQASLKQKNSEDDILDPVLEYIDENYMKDIELADLCRIMKVTPQYLCRIFKNKLGVRPLEYITKKRIQTAKQMMLMNTLPVKSIAEAVGYSNSGYFCTVFKKYEGVSPGEYQKFKRF